jgi:hypothetical protein
MRHVRLAGLGFAAFLAAAPAFAQLSMGGGGSPGGPAPQPKGHVPEDAPAAVPGMGQAPVQTGPVVAKPVTGDPTAALFAAVNNGDYNAAQDAISRGADLTSEDALGETPLDLAISLNRSAITFLLLQTRNETGGGGGAPGPVLPAPKPSKVKITPAAEKQMVHVPVMGNDPGTPDPSAGFLGFGAKN